MSGHALETVVQQQRVFAVIRTDTPQQALAAARACLAGGLRLLEITLTVPEALGVVERLAGEPDAVAGVGSLVDPADVGRAARSGARFVVSPHFDADVLAEAKARGLYVAMGGVTATEAVTCHRAGVDATKLFPATAFGPGYLKALREPLPFLRLIPTGGVDEANLCAWLDAGAVAAGLGGSLADRKSVTAGEFGVVEARARRIVAAVADWRAARGR